MEYPCAGRLRLCTSTRKPATGRRCARYLKRKETLVMDRRQFVTASGSVIALSVGASLRRVAFAAIPSASEATERLNALFDTFMDERLTKNPTQLTVLGLDKGKYAWARAKLTDASLERVRGFKQENASRLQRLKAFDRSSLSAGDLANYDTVA